MGAFSDSFLSPSLVFFSPSLVSSGDFSADPSVTVASAPSTPSAPSPATSSAGFSGSFMIVGAATVAITKSLPWIVGATFSGNFIEEILILAPMSKLSRSTTSSLGIF